MKKKISCLLLALLLLVQIPLLAAADGGDVAAESRSGVVRIVALRPDGYYSLGSGFGVGTIGEETEYFVTNHHVLYDTYLMDNNSYMILPAIEVWILKNSNAWNPATYELDKTQCVSCEIVYGDDNGNPDVAVIKAVEPVPGRVALGLISEEDDEALDGGDKVYALGYPSTSDMLEGSFYGDKWVGGVKDVTITDGVISRLVKSGAMDNTKLIQHTAQINHGNSGGPLLNERGAVIGINTYLFGQDTSTGDTNSFASVRIEHVKEVLDDEGIYWEEVGPETNWLLIGIIAGAVVLIAVVVVIIIVVASKSKTSTTPPPVAVQPAQPSQPRPVQQSAPQQANDPRPRLQCLAGAFAGKRFSLDNTVRIGRDPNRNDLVVPANTQGISGVHCVLMVEGTTVWLKDLGSTYGTYVAGGRRLGANEAVQLNIGDRFWLGSENELFVIAPKGGI